MPESMPGVALGDVRGPLNDLMEKLSGSDGHKWLRAVKKTLRGENPWDFVNVCLNWRTVYEKLGLIAEYESLLVAKSEEMQEAVDTWAVPVLKGATPNKIIQVLRDLGVAVYLYVDDLDKDAMANDRDPTPGSYVVRFQRTIEADPELANLSAKMLAEQGIKGITLLERLLLELAYFLAIEEHLDVENATLCSGSHCLDGDVPCVYWSAGYRRLCVRWYSPDDRRGFLCARAAVSLSAEASAKAG